MINPDKVGDQKQLIMQRAKARQSKDWAASDRLRDQLSKQGITLRDTSAGQLWSKS